METWLFKTIRLEEWSTFEIISHEHDDTESISEKYFMFSLKPRQIGSFHYNYPT